MKKSQRAVAFIAAIVFFLTSVGFSALVIWQINEDKETAEIISSLQQQTAGQQNLQDLPTDEPAETENKEGTLEGTKLANFTPIDKVEKLEIIDIETGTGEAVKPGDTVTAHYTGALAKDGTIFQSSHDTGQPIPFSLDGVIQGWTEGVPGMKVGGKRRLVIPAEQAYGASSPSPNIPPNSDLVFDIELVAIGEPQS